jgi:hypothetical protein
MIFYMLAAINPLTTRYIFGANTRRACAHSILALDQRVARAPDGATSAPRVSSHEDKALGDLADRTETAPSPPAPTARIAARVKPTHKRLGHLRRCLGEAARCWRFPPGAGTLLSVRC